MRQSIFVQRRREGWQRLEALLGIAERRGLRALSPEEIEELGRMYRWVTSDLAFAGGREYDPNLQAYLHRLTARSHAYVYAGNVEGGWSRVVRFLAHDFPQEVRNSRWYILTSVAIFVGPAIMAYAMVTASPTNAYIILPEAWVRPIHEKLHDSNFGFDRDWASTMSAAILTNNIRVALYAFAGGIVTLGAFTVYLIYLTGLQVGGLGAMYTNAGYGYDFWATIAPHGVIELTAIQVAAGAGFLMAAAVFNPGRLRVRDALKRNASRALVLIVGVVCMLVCAALIEGFFSPQRFPPELRLTVGGLTALVLVYYFGFQGREDAAPERSSDAVPEGSSDAVPRS